jgi:aminoglycoside phosphotransferase (APT) family kinase protein
MTALTALLTRLMQTRFGPNAEVREMTRLSGGASQETWGFSLQVPNEAPRHLILRRAPFQSAAKGEAIGLVKEAQIIAAAAQTGTPVPEIIHVCGPEDDLGDAFIMAHVAGQTIARKILRDEEYSLARPLLAFQCGEALAKIHAVAPDNLPPDLPISHGLDQLDRYEAIYRGFDMDRPVFELALSWLRQHAPPPLPTTLVHGDFRNGNLMVNESGLAAVLDWELAHQGDPREDLGWICVNSWRFGMRDKKVGGFGPLEELLAGYQASGGQSFEPKDLDWFQALGSFKWGIMCLIMYQAFATKADPSIERAMIGRRASEAEIDLLNLIEGRPHA